MNKTTYSSLSLFLLGFILILPGCTDQENPSESVSSPSAELSTPADPGPAPTGQSEPEAGSIGLPPSTGE